MPSQLAALLRRHSIRRGDFVLASGARSDVYIDAKLTTCQAAGMKLTGQAFLEKIRELGWQPYAAGGLMVGAAPIALAIARESLETGPPIQAFLVRKEPKKHGAQRSIEGLDETRGLEVVVVEDVCTGGGSTQQAVDGCREAGMNVLGAICLVDREAGGWERLAKVGCELHSIFKLGDLLAK